MEIKHIISHIKYLVGITPQCDFNNNIKHAMEELGEVAKAERCIRYASRHADPNDEGLKEARADLIEETVDLAITAFATYISAGGRPDDFYAIFMRKCSKWENNVKPKTS